MDLESLQAVFADLGAGVCVVDVTGAVVRSDPPAGQLPGYREAELSGRNLHEAIYGGSGGQPVPDTAYPLLTAVRPGRPADRDHDVFLRAVPVGAEREQ